LCPLLQRCDAGPFLCHLQLLLLLLRGHARPSKWDTYLASSGYVAEVDAELCARCGSCADACQFAAISVDHGLARIDVAACMDRGMCVAHCPQAAISLLRDPVKGKPLEIEKLIAHAGEVTER
jgi:MinD superfamily P-loop ATPase